MTKKIPRLERSWERRYFRRVKITIRETAPVVKPGTGRPRYRFDPGTLTEGKDYIIVGE